MVPYVSATGGTHRPAIPVRNSSISRDGGTDRHSSLIGDDSCLPESSRRHPGQNSTINARKHPKNTSPTPEMDQTAASCSKTRRNATHPAKAQRWAGLTRSVSGWDNLRKVIQYHSPRIHLANKLRIPNCGSKMEIAKFIYTRWGHLAEVLHSVCLQGRFDKRSVVLYSRSAMHR
jgi:hypothetical protein